MVTIIIKTILKLHNLCIKLNTRLIMVSNQTKCNKKNSHPKQFIKNETKKFIRYEKQKIL